MARPQGLGPIVAGEKMKQSEIENRKSKIGNPRLPGFEEPALSRRARKDEICPAGGFASVPLAMLRRRDVPGYALKVYIALLDDLRGAAQWVATTIGDLGAKTGYARPTVRKAVAWLCSRGFIERKRQRGNNYLTSFAHPDDWRPEQSDRDPTSETRGSLPSETRGSLARSETRGSLPSETRGSLPSETRGSPPSLTRTQVNTHTQETAGVCDFDSELKKQADDAYREVFGYDPPATWTEKVRREVENGSRELLARIDAAAVRAGIKRAKDRQRTFGFGWVMNYLADEPPRKSVKQQRQQGVGLDDEHAAKTLRAKMQSHFASLPAGEHDALLAEAETLCRWNRKPEIVRAMAVDLAWQRRKTEVLT